MDSLFKLCLKFVLLHVILSKSIRNNTDTDSRMDFMKTSMEKTEQRILNLTNQVTKFTKMEFNEVQYEKGADFNSGDGVFVSPVSGVFMFAWTTRTSGAKNIDTELRVDNVVKARQILSIPSGHFQSTQFVICRVNEGDHVWIETGQGFTSDNIFD
ncbi:Hypothetical predicted protein [Mytilus galloprovincialis]|uniref:C1q domain-containing protein n=1 Tax=Mytilus galloprovincialis TaxID=29158 RepID=A0A8B6DAU9_MYTGA|nr:Hypothetical predicted protein [Mytilus galloprovincialis]